jgi:putative peptidoglycan lipid II flippase
MGQATRAGIVRSASRMSLAIMASRILGLVRDMFFSFLFGAGAAMDAFNVAFRIHNLLRDLFAEGAMSAAFVPTFTQTMTRRGLAEAWRLANLVVHALLIIVSLIVIVGIVWAPEIIHLYAAGFEDVPGKLALTIKLTGIMMPFLLCVALAAWAMGCLNARGRFFVPALAPAMFNLATICMGIAIWLSPASFGAQPIVWMAVAALIGGVLQIAIQLPLLWKEGFRFRLVPRLRAIFLDEGVKRMLSLMLPATVGLAATQVNIFVNTYFAASIPSAVSWLNYAFRLMYLPIGLFGVTIAAATLPAVSRHVAEGDRGEFRATLAHSLRLVFAFNIPASIGLVVLGVPIIRLLFERRAFLPSDTEATAAALAYYALGLFAYSGVKVLVPAYYALGRTRMPVAISVFSVAVNIALNSALIGPMGHRGLALATSVAAILSLLLLIFFMHRAAGGIEAGNLLASFTKIVLAGAAMGTVAWQTHSLLEALLGAAGVRAQAACLAAAIGAGVVTLLAVGRLLRIREIDEVFGGLLGRFRR